MSKGPIKVCIKFHRQATRMWWNKLTPKHTCVHTEIDKTFMVWYCDGSIPGDLALGFWCPGSLGRHTISTVLTKKDRHIIHRNGENWFNCYHNHYYHRYPNCDCFYHYYYCFCYYHYHCYYCYCYHYNYHCNYHHYHYHHNYYHIWLQLSVSSLLL